MLSRRIENIAYEILQSLNITELPIPIKEIAKKRGLQIKPFDFGDNVSGMLMIDNGTGTIGYNPLESGVRQRFTVAHELGHYILHRNKNEIFVDKQFKPLYRDERSSTGEIRLEQEANAFAAAILMPRDMVEQKIREMSFDLADETCMKELAKVFDVSIQAMSFRISNLAIF